MLGIIEVNIQDGQPVGDILNFVIAHTLCHKVVTDYNLENPALVLIADGIGTGGVVAVLFHQGSGDLHAFPGRVGTLSDQSAQGITHTAGNTFGVLGIHTAVGNHRYAIFIDKGIGKGLTIQAAELGPVISAGFRNLVDNGSAVCKADCFTLSMLHAGYQMGLYHTAGVVLIVAYQHPTGCGSVPAHNDGAAVRTGIFFCICHETDHVQNSFLLDE